MSQIKYVVPLESNPEVFSSFAHALGLTNSFTFMDIYSLTDPDLIGFVPTPVRAIILLFPINEYFEKSKEKDSETVEGSKNPVWFKQTIKNACGLYALLHSLSNNQDLLEEGSDILNFFKNNSNPNAGFFDNKTDDFIVGLSQQYSQNFETGQTEAPAAEDDVNLHFVTFIEKNGNIYELDGRRPKGAFLLGPVQSKSADVDDRNLLGEKIIADRVQWYMDNADNQNKLNFSLLGLAPAFD